MFEFRILPSEYFKTTEAPRKVADFSHSIGPHRRADGQDRVGRLGQPGVRRDRVQPGAPWLAVYGIAYKVERLKEAITAAKGGAPIELLFKAGERFRSVRIAYRGGLRYPQLERIEGTADRLGELFAAKP